MCCQYLLVFGHCYQDIIAFRRKRSSNIKSLELEDLRLCVFLFLNIKYHHPLPFDIYIAKKNQSEVLEFANSLKFLNLKKKQKTKKDTLYSKGSYLTPLPPIVIMTLTYSYFSM